ncbi:DUF72 domain-containing protein [Sphingobium sp. RAC03]|uniref:DUF72 domain-containing protein n=1 Tax=Sphingobium sp. RAC03 TaxID=1843368 RepID=UPI00083CDF6C|nr:DUF72 domain-containing protein [Sphingobium sp. RAC03]AOF95087.1 hypothetical protein BSY17_3227 [Sphingobium sp. RAC03]
MTLIIGTAGWSISKRHAQAFPEEGSALQRYAARFRGVEINSSFYRPHRSSTWARWHDSVPQDFRFAVKMPKAVSHQCRLLDCREQTATFIENIDALGSKLDVLLLQLPPSLAFDETAVGNFFEMLSGLTDVRTACEPRHASWFLPPADRLLADLGIARVAADPFPVARPVEPGGYRAFEYWRLHGSPRVYRSAYGDERMAPFLPALMSVAGRPASSWCVFDNTAESAAIGDAMLLSSRLEL